MTRYLLGADMLETVSLSARLRELLDERKWSARELARRAGLSSAAHINEVLKDPTGKTTFRGDTLTAITNALGVRAEWLQSGSGSPTPDETAPTDPRAAGEVLFLEDIEARAPHRLPAARTWLETARAAQHAGTEQWGRMVWFRYYLGEWNAHRKAAASALTPPGAIPAQPSGESAHQRWVRETKASRGE